jgi:hypothetical protein
MTEEINIKMRLDTAKALSKKGELLSIDVKLDSGEVKPVYIRKQDLEAFRNSDSVKVEQTAVSKVDKAGAKEFAETVLKEIAKVAPDKTAKELREEFIAKRNSDNMSSGSAPAKKYSVIGNKAIKLEINIPRLNK